MARGLFVIDACDREIIGWLAVANAGIAAEMVCDLMITSVERRFGSTRTAHRVEWLTDNVLRAEGNGADGQSFSVRQHALAA
jgi:putative transposase